MVSPPHDIASPSTPSMVGALGSPESDWLVHALRGECYWPPKGMGLDPKERLLAAADTNGVKELLFAKLRTDPVWEQLPDPMRQELTRSNRQAGARELYFEEEIAKDLDALAAAGIDALLLKGTALAYNLYPSPALRPRCDTDLLLRDKETANEAWGLLRERGFERSPAVSGDFVSHQYCCARRVAPQAGIVLDVHWKLSNSNFFAAKLSFDELRSKRVPVSTLGPNAFALSHPHALLHALFHRIWHLGAGEQERLIWLYDIDLICRHFSAQQWERFTELVTSCRMGPICRVGIEEASKLLGTRLPDGLLESIGTPSAGTRRQLELGRPGWRRALADIQYLPSWSDRLGLVRELFFPGRNYMEQRFGTTGSLSLILGYTKRTFRGLRRVFQR